MKDKLSEKALEILQNLWKRTYLWKNEWDRWGFDHLGGEQYTPFIKYFQKAKRYEYDPYWENSDQAGIGMQTTIITGDNPERYTGFYPLPKEKVVLDIGAGNGELMKFMSQYGKNTVIGMDAGLLGQQRFWEGKRYKNNTLLYMDVSRDRFPFPDNVFDIIFFTETIEHLTDPLHALLEAKRVLKEYGHLIITFPEPEDQRGYWGGNHSFIYPGMFYRHHFRRFMIQLFFKQLKYRENGGTGKYVFENINDGFINPVALAKGDWQGNLLYKDVRRDNEDMEAIWEPFTKEEIKKYSKDREGPIEEAIAEMLKEWDLKDLVTKRS